MLKRFHPTLPVLQKNIWVADPHHLYQLYAYPDPAFNSDAGLDPAPSIKVMEIPDHFSTDPPELHFEPPGFTADPDPAPNNADPWKNCLSTMRHIPVRQSDYAHAHATPGGGGQESYAATRAID